MCRSDLTEAFAASRRIQPTCAGTDTSRLDMESWLFILVVFRALANAK